MTIDLDSSLSTHSSLKDTIGILDNMALLNELANDNGIWLRMKDVSCLKLLPSLFDTKLVS